MNKIIKTYRIGRPTPLHLLIECIIAAHQLQYEYRPSICQQLTSNTLQRHEKSCTNH